MSPWLVLPIIALMIPILAIVLDSKLGKAIASRFERKNMPGGDRAAQERLAFLEGEVERLGREVERLDEEGRFMQKLLAHRQESPALPSGDRASGNRASANRSPRDQAPGKGTRADDSGS